MARGGFQPGENTITSCGDYVFDAIQRFHARDAFHPLSATPQSALFEVILNTALLPQQRLGLIRTIPKRFSGN